MKTLSWYTFLIFPFQACLELIKLKNRWTLTIPSLNHSCQYQKQISMMWFPQHFQLVLGPECSEVTWGEVTRKSMYPDFIWHRASMSVHLPKWNNSHLLKKLSAVWPAAAPGSPQTSCTVPSHGKAFPAGKEAWTKLSQRWGDLPRLPLCLLGFRPILIDVPCWLEPCLSFSILGKCQEATVSQLFHGVGFQTSLKFGEQLYNNSTGKSAISSQKWNRCLLTTSVKSVCAVLEFPLCWLGCFRFCVHVHTDSFPFSSPPFNWSAESEIFKEYSVSSVPGYNSHFSASLKVRCSAPHKTSWIVFTRAIKFLSSVGTNTSAYQKQKLVPNTLAVNLLQSVSQNHFRAHRCWLCLQVVICAHERS